MLYNNAMNHTHAYYCGCTVSQSVPHERATLASTLECSCLASVAIDSARDGRTPHDRRVVGDMPCTCTDSTVPLRTRPYMHATRGREASCDERPHATCLPRMHASPSIGESSPGHREAIGDS